MTYTVDTIADKAHRPGVYTGLNLPRVFSLLTPRQLCFEVNEK